MMQNFMQKVCDFCKHLTTRFIFCGFIVQRKKPDGINRVFQFPIDSHQAEAGSSQ